MSTLPYKLKRKIWHHLNWPELPTDERTRFLTLALCGEVGEMTESVGHTLTPDLEKELADVGNYLFMLAFHTGVSLRVYTEKSMNALHGNPLHLTLDLCEATGKIANLVKKSWRGDFDLVSRAEDFSIHMHHANLALFDLALHFDLDLSQLMLDKMIEVEQREVFKNRNQGNEPTS